MTSSFFADRLNKTKLLLAEKNIDAAVFSSVSNITYLTNFSGFSSLEREGFVLITQDKNYTITDARLITAVKNIVDFEPLEITAKTPFSCLLQNILPPKAILGVETNNLTASEYLKIKLLCKKIQHFDLSPIRVTKTSDEIKAIEKACKLGDLAFEYIIKQIKENITEKQLAKLLEFFIKENGGDLSFPSIVAFGENAAIPHHQTSSQRLKTNCFVLLDFGVKINNYCSDMTRTIFFGIADLKAKNIYETVRIAQQKAIDLLEKCHSELVSEPQEKTRSRNKFGMTGRTVDKIARDYIIANGYPTIPHSLGHGIGLDVHEAPRLSPNSQDVLGENMVFSIEPGIYLPKQTGVRIEDLVVLEKKGLRVLTTAPKTLIEISQK